MPVMSNLHRAKSGTYFYRRTVPKELRAALKKREHWESLKTSDPAEAKRRFPDAHRRADELFDRHRPSAPPFVSPSDEGMPRLTAAEIDAAVCEWRDQVVEEDFVLEQAFNRNERRSDEGRRKVIAGKRRWAEYLRRCATTCEFPDNIVRMAQARLEQMNGKSSTIATDSAEFRLLCVACCLGMADLYEAEARWFEGDFTYRPSNGIFVARGMEYSAPRAGAAAPVALTPTPSTPGSADSLMTVFERRMAEKQDMSAKTQHELRTVMRRLTEALGGDPPIAAITQVQMRTFQEALVQMPRRMSRDLHRRPILEIMAMTKDDRTIQRVTPETVRKQIGLLQAFFAWCKRRGYLEKNFAEGLKPDKSRHLGRKRIDLSTEDLIKVFSSPIYTGCRSAEDRATSGDVIIKDHYYWIPLLAIFSGGRLEELGSLLLAEVKSDQGILFLDLDIIEKDEDSDTKVAADEQMKNDPSLRRVPIHPTILACGFAQYVQELRDRGEKRLFPRLRPDKRGKLTSPLSKGLNGLLRRLGITDRCKVFHSTRHSFKTACRMAGLPEDVHDALTGHSNGSVGRTYGQMPITTLADAMARINYPGLDLSHLFDRGGALP